MQKFLNLTISGLVTGAIYSIMASGLVLTYQTSGVFNFAHAAVAFTSAYFYFQLHFGEGIPFPRRSSRCSSSHRCSDSHSIASCSVA